MNFFGYKPNCRKNENMEPREKKKKNNGQSDVIPGYRND